MVRRLPSTRPDWSWRWGQLARGVRIDPDEKLLVALSGGADSVLLLHLLSAAVPRPAFRAAHVDHNLRGEESRADARFCENLCRALGVPFSLHIVELSPDGSSLEARAREARYRAVIEEAVQTGHRTILTGHHSDDALETLLMRWIRGTHLPGLQGLRSRVTVDPARAFGGVEVDDGALLRSPVAIVRPLIGMRRAEVRRLLSDRGLTWREDATNRDPRFTRSRVRHGLLPTLRRIGGDDAIENLRSFGRAVEDLEEQLAGATAHISWMPAPYAAASRGPADAALGGVLDRAGLMPLVPALRRRVVWRLIVEGTGRAPGQRLLDRLVDDLGAGRCTRHSLPGKWTLVLRSKEIHLVPTGAPSWHANGGIGAHGPGLETIQTELIQPGLPFPGAALPPTPPRLPLPVPGITTLPDGRRISAERARVSPGAPVRRGTLEVDLDADRLPAKLTIRWPEPGDRFHALGAPGSKTLKRFLADSGIPREERDRVPVVLAGSEIIWVVGVRPAETCRVLPSTHNRLRLSLHETGKPAWAADARGPEAQIGTR